MSAFCCALGPQGGYFFGSPTARVFNNLPPALATLLSQGNVVEVYDVALGQNGTYYVGYRTTNGQTSCSFTNLPHGLRSWLITPDGTPARDIASVTISLGANDGYFASDKNSSSWANLPAGLEKSISSRLDASGRWQAYQKPLVVALGYDGAYIMTAADGGGAWDTRGQSAELERYAQETPNFQNVLSIHLDSSSSGTYSVVFRNGSCFSHLPESHYGPFNQVSSTIPNLEAKVHSAQSAQPIHSPQTIQSQPIHNTMAVSASYAVHQPAATPAYTKPMQYAPSQPVQQIQQRQVSSGASYYAPAASAPVPVPVQTYGVAASAVYAAPQPYMVPQQQQQQVQQTTIIQQQPQQQSVGDAIVVGAVAGATAAVVADAMTPAYGVGYVDYGYTDVSCANLDVTNMEVTSVSVDSAGDVSYTDVTYTDVSCDY